MLPHLVASKISKGQPSYSHCILAKRKGACLEDDLFVSEFTFQLFSCSSHIINPCLLPLFCSRIIGIKTFARIPDAPIYAGTCPFFKNDTTVEDKSDPAVTGLIAIFSIHIPFADPEIKLAINRIG